MHKFPNAGSAHVDPIKLTGYLLSLTHPQGKSKATWFRMLGFDEANVGELSLELRRMPVDGTVTEIVENSFGTKYVVEGMLIGPHGAGMVRSVWIINDHSSIPRLITAYPTDD